MIYETENYKGFQIDIVQDEDPENPFEAWDCEPPLAVYSCDYGSITEYAMQYGNVNNPPILTREQILANKTLIFDLFAVKSWFSLRSIREYTDVDFADVLNNELTDILCGMNDSDRLDTLCDLYNAAGIPAICEDVRGSSQGDWAKVLAVATPEFQKACGNGPGFDWHKSLKQSIQLFEDWAFGNVYGYSIDDLDASCFGYYGDPETSGLLDDAKSAIDNHIESERREHLDRVKTWIRNRVPLTHRIFA